MGFGSGPARFDLAGKLGVFAAIEYQPGQAERLVRGKLAGQGDDDLRGGLDADNGGRTGPADDSRDQCSCDGAAASVLP